MAGRKGKGGRPTFLSTQVSKVAKAKAARDEAREVANKASKKSHDLRKYVGNCQQDVDRQRGQLAMAEAELAVAQADYSSAREADSEAQDVLWEAQAKLDVAVAEISAA